VYNGSEVRVNDVARVAVAVSMMDTVEAAWTGSLRHEVVIGRGRRAFRARSHGPTTCVDNYCYEHTDHMDVRR
jgi:hypothetical protein